MFNKFLNGLGVVFCFSATAGLVYVSIGLAGYLEQMNGIFGEDLAKIGAKEGPLPAVGAALGAGLAFLLGMKMVPEKEIPESEYRGRRPYDGDEESSEE